MSYSKNTLFMLGMVLFIGAVGVFGYSWIEGWGLQDSLYMTLITLTTTGYQEVHPMSPEGRVFTMFLLVLGMGVVAFSFSQIAKSIMSINFYERRRRKMHKQIKLLNDHIIVCGYGRMGRVIAKELSNKNVPFVIIENRENSVKELEKSSYYWIHGDAAHDDILVSANIRSAHMVACMVDSDSDSLYISLAAKSLNPSVHVVARANTESAKQKILRAGADKVVLPLMVSALKVAQNLINPSIENLLSIDDVRNSSEHHLQVAEFIINEDSLMLGKNLKNCELKTRGFMVVGICHKNGEFTFAPCADYIFSDGDKIVSLTTPETQTELIEAKKVA